jgi:predicted double-glycine peptidase
MILRANLDQIIDFPEVRQNAGYTCGVSALQAILYYYGYSLTESQLSHILGVTEKTGTNPQRIVSFCRKLGFHVIEQQHMTLKDVDHYLNQKMPILVSYQAWGTVESYLNSWSSGHYSVIIGAYDDKIIMEDPSLIGRGYLSTAEFLDRWHDVDSDGHIYHQYGIIICGKAIKYHTDKLYPIG